MTKPSWHWSGCFTQRKCPSIAAVVSLAVAAFSAHGQDVTARRLPSAIAPSAEAPATPDFVAPSQIAPSIDDVGPTRFQSGLPTALILPPPSDAARKRESRFVEAEIDPELPLSLVVGRPKILRLTDTLRRIFVPDEETIRAEIIDRESGRELAVTGLTPRTTTLMLWFDDKADPSGQSIIRYLVRVYEDPL